MPTFDTIREKVPPVKKRAGDFVIAGSNNATVVLGTDRETTTTSGHGQSEGAGAIYVVVGRNSENYDLARDKSYLYVSSLADPDKYAGTVGSTNEKKAPAAIVKSDHVRIVARKSLKIVVGSCELTMSADGSVTIDGDLKLGSGAVDRLLKGDAFVNLVHATHTHTAPGGVTGPPLQPVPPSVFSRRGLVE